LPSLDAKPLNSTLSLPLCHHSLLSPAPSLQFNSLSPVKSKLLLLILTEFLLSMVRPATEWFVYFFFSLSNVVFVCLWFQNPLLLLLINSFVLFKREIGNGAWILLMF